MATFRGASADAVAALTDDLDAALGGSDAAELGDQLFAVAATVRSEGALRRFLTDGSVPEEARGGLVDQVFGSRVGEAAQRLLGSAVRRRWTLARDLADALEQLGVVAHVRSARGESERLSDELFTLGQAVKGHVGLRDALADPARTRQDKTGLLETLLGGRALPATSALAAQSLSGSYRTVSAALTAYQRVASEAHGQGVATVRVARPLGEGDRARLAAVLAGQYGRAVHLNVVVEPGLIGGIRVEIGDDVIDGTVASRLDEARRSLVGA